MAINIDKILTISARDYADLVGKKLEDYEAVGMHITEIISAGTMFERLTEEFASRVQKEVEVVVDYKASIGGREYNFIYHVSGTALIPKKK